MPRRQWRRGTAPHIFKLGTNSMEQSPSCEYTSFVGSQEMSHIFSAPYRFIATLAHPKRGLPSCSPTPKEGTAILQPNSQRADCHPAAQLPKSGLPYCSPTPKERTAILQPNSQRADCHPAAQLPPPKRNLIQHRFYTQDDIKSLT
jgi:hypothetical protein